MKVYVVSTKWSEEAVAARSVQEAIRKYLADVKKHNGRLFSDCKQVESVTLLTKKDIIGL